MIGICELYLKVSWVVLSAIFSQCVYKSFKESSKRNTDLDSVVMVPSNLLRQATQQAELVARLQPQHPANIEVKKHLMQAQEYGLPENITR